MEDDPIVMWVLDLDSGKEINLEYSVSEKITGDKMNLYENPVIFDMEVESKNKNQIEEIKEEDIVFEEDKELQEIEEENSSQIEEENSPIITGKAVSENKETVKKDSDKIYLISGAVIAVGLLFLILKRRF